VAVNADAAHASYDSGVRRVELPKQQPRKPGPFTIRVE
jgi:HSP20 family molecular chaperone IbpA